MIDGTKLKYVIKQVVELEFNYPLACQILDIFEEKASTLSDYDVLGELSIMAKHDKLRLKSAHFALTNSKNSEQLFKARENLYKTYNALNQPEMALFYININLTLKPDDVETLMHKAFNLALMNKKEEAEDILRSIITNDPKQKESLEFALSGHQLRVGKTAEGIRNFIMKFKPKNVLFEDNLKLKFWDGGIYPGKTIVVNGEGGIGDEIINIRFFDWFKKYNMKPILFSSWYKYRPDLVDLFRKNGYEVSTNHMFFKQDCLWTHLMALPGYMNLSESELWNGPYLTPNRNPKNKINDTKFKIGIKCNGNPYFDQDVYRKIPINSILNALPKDNVSIYYFDKEKTHPDCVDMRDKLETWEDTLDYIDQMDIIVSSCTSLVHAAGAMGKRTIVMVPIAEYYTWTSTRKDETTPWYGDNFTVLKQTKPRDWSEPLKRARELIDVEMRIKNAL